MRKHVITANELARRLVIHRSTLHRLRHRGIITGVQITDAWHRYSEAAVAAALRRCHVGEGNRDSRARKVPDLATAIQVADVLSVSSGTILRWARRAQIPHFRLMPGLVRFDPAEIEEWVKQQHKGGGRSWPK